MPKLTEKDVCNVLDHEENVRPGVTIVGLRSRSVLSVSKELNRESFRQGLEGTKVDWLD